MDCPKEIVCLFISGIGYGSAEVWLRWKGISPVQASLAEIDKINSK